MWAIRYSGQGRIWAAGAKISNFRSLPGEIRLDFSDGRLALPGEKFGAVLGDGAEVGCNAVLYPGSILGPRCVVYPLVGFRGTAEAETIVKGVGSEQRVPRR